MSLLQVTKGRNLILVAAASACIGMINRQRKCKLYRPNWMVNAKELEELTTDVETVKLQVKADKEMTWEKVTARSALVVGSSVSGLLEVTATRWIECETLYHKYLQTLIDLMTAYVNAIGSPAADELWDTLMFVRGFLAEVKDERKQLALLWNNCEGLAEHAGQAAFHTGAEFSGCRLGEFVANAQMNMSRLSKVSADLELYLASVEAKEIRKSVKQKELERSRVADAPSNMADTNDDAAVEETVT